MAAAAVMIREMSDIRWIGAHAERAVLEQLVAFDHQSIEIAGETAVLISYTTTTSPDRGVIAVFHDAAGRYPSVPRWVQDIVDRLEWSETAGDIPLGPDPAEVPFIDRGEGTPPSR